MLPSERILRALSGDSSSWENRLSIFLFALLFAASFWSTALIEFSAALLVLLYIFGRMKDRNRGIFFPPSVESKKRKEFSLTLLLWGIYVGGVVVSIIFSPFKDTSLRYLAKHWHALLFPVACSLNFSCKDMKLVGGSFLFSASLAASAGIARFIYQESGYLEALYKGNTTFASLLVLAAIMGIGHMLSRTKRDDVKEGFVGAESLIVVTLALPIILAVVFAALMAPVAALVVGSLVLVLVSRPKAIFPWTLFVGAILVISPRVLWLEFEWIMAGNHIDRYPLWSAGAKLLSSVPTFGFGPESFCHILPANASAAFAARPPATWHNDFLQTILDNGWLVGGAYIGFVISLVIVTIRRAIRTRDYRIRALFKTLAVLLTTFVFFSMIGTVVSSATLGIVWWTILGLIANIAIKERTHGFTRTDPEGSPG